MPLITIARPKIQREPMAVPAPISMNPAVFTTAPVANTRALPKRASRAGEEKTVTSAPIEPTSRMRPRSAGVSESWSRMLGMRASQEKAITPLMPKTPISSSRARSCTARARNARFTTTLQG